jgi:mannose-1-phosphate guanylyltransferase
MVLAAGFGTRLRPLTNILPKPLVPVANRPLIEYTLRLLAKSGTHRIVVNLHHLGDRIPAALGDGSHLGIEITYSPEEEILGTGGGLVRMREFLEGGSFFVLNADVLTGVDLSALYRFHQERGAAATMVVRPYPAQGGYTPLEMDEAGWLTDFKDAHRTPQGRTRPVLFCGVHVLEPAVFDFLPSEGFSCVNSQAYTGMIASGLDVAAFVDEGPWFDLGDPGLYLAANRALLSGSLCLPQLGPLQGVAPDGVLLGERVNKEPEVSLGPEVAVGDDCVLGRGCKVARSVIWPESIVKPGARLDSVVVAGEMVVET